MKKSLILTILFMHSAFAQYNPGLPIPGLPTSVGQKARAASTSVTLAYDQQPITITGSITATNASIGTNYATAPTSSTEIGGIDSNGKLQPVLIGLDGITVSATSVKVSSSTISRTSNNTSNQTLLTANANRKGAFFYNDSTTNCYVKFGATATSSSYSIKLFSTDTYIMDAPTYTGIVDYVCDAASGSMQVTEQ